MNEITLVVPSPPQPQGEVLRLAGKTPLSLMQEFAKLLLKYAEQQDPLSKKLLEAGKDVLLYVRQNHAKETFWQGIAAKVDALRELVFPATGNPFAEEMREWLKTIPEIPHALVPVPPVVVQLQETQARNKELEQMVALLQQVNVRYMEQYKQGLELQHQSHLMQTAELKRGLGGICTQVAETKQAYLEATAENDKQLAHVKGELYVAQAEIARQRGEIDSLMNSLHQLASEVDHLRDKLGGRCTIM